MQKPRNVGWFGIMSALAAGIAACMSGCTYSNRMTWTKGVGFAYKGGEFFAIVVRFRGEEMHYAGIDSREWYQPHEKEVYLLRYCIAEAVHGKCAAYNVEPVGRVASVDNIHETEAVSSAFERLWIAKLIPDGWSLCLGGSAFHDMASVKMSDVPYADMYYRVGAQGDLRCFQRGQGMAADGIALQVNGKAVVVYDHGRQSASRLEVLCGDYSIWSPDEHIVLPIDMRVGDAGVDWKVSGFPMELAIWNYQSGLIKRVQLVLPEAMKS